MESPITPLLADTCMNWVIKKASMSGHTSQPTCLFRYVDDLFCIFLNANQLNSYFNNISDIHPNIKFTKELENCNQLPYLDVLLRKNQNKI